VLAIGLFGSLARGDWGVGSDVDLIVISEAPALDLDTSALPVAADVLLRSPADWTALPIDNPNGAALQRETVWIVDRRGPADAL
jgi:uncharacterized protein